MNTLQTLKQKAKSKKGFTLMEMLIVVAIVAILVAIALPTFSNALDSAKKAVDEANIRAAQGLASTQYLTNVADNKADVTVNQKVVGSSGNDYAMQTTGTYTIDSTEYKYKKGDKLTINVDAKGKLTISGNTGT